VIKQETRLSPRHPRNALYQLKCCSAIVQIKHTDLPCQPEDHFQQLSRSIRFPAKFRTRFVVLSLTIAQQACTASSHIHVNAEVSSACHEQTSTQPTLLMSTGP